LQNLKENIKLTIS